MIFEVKQDGRRKAQLVTGGNMVDPMDINTQSTVVKGIRSVQELLELISHRGNLSILCGDILGNSFITAKDKLQSWNRVWETRMFSSCFEESLVWLKIIELVQGVSRPLCRLSSWYGILVSFALWQGCLDAQARTRRWLRLHLHPCRRFLDSRSFLDSRLRSTALARTNLRRFPPQTNWPSCLLVAIWAMTIIFRQTRMYGS